MKHFIQFFVLSVTVIAGNAADGGIVTVSPAAEGDITNTLVFLPGSFHTAPIINLSGQERRSIAEFALGPFLGSTINSATLLFTESSDPGVGTQIQIHGYVGDGVGSGADFFNITNPIGAPGFNDGNNIVESLDVTTFVSGLVTNGDSFAGFLWQRLAGSGSAFVYDWQNAQLEVDFAASSNVVPEPSAIAIWCLIGLTVVGYSRFRRRHR